MRKICVITGSRAEYGLLYYLMKEVDADSKLQLQVVVTGTHLSSAHGSTYKLIEKDGFKITKKVAIPLSSDTRVAVTKSIGTAIGGFAEVFAALKPDIVVLLGDRYEIFSAATAATVARLPIAHIHGGESTEGAFDETFRHAITKMSLLHFAAAEAYKKRIIQMGEPPERVFCVGALGLEHLNRTPLLGKDELERSIEFKLVPPTFLVTYHPVTLENDTSLKSIKELLKSLNIFKNARIIFTQANADPNNNVINSLINELVTENKERMVFYTSLGYQRYLSLLKFVDVVIGNSSSGIIEVPAFKKPTVNIGDRQRGRLMANSILNCKTNAKEISTAIKQALSPEFQKRLSSINNPYDGGNASVVIKNILRDFTLEKNCLKKKFYNISSA